MEIKEFSNGLLKFVCFAIISSPTYIWSWHNLLLEMLKLQKRCVTNDYNNVKWGV